MRTTVAVIGAGPAGLLLSRMLHQEGIDCVVLEARDRAYIERRQRAGTLEQSTVETLRTFGAGDRLDREGIPHHAIELRYDRQPFRLDLHKHTGRTVTLYPQTKIVTDLVALNLQDGIPILFEAQATKVERVEGPNPVVHFRHAGRDDQLECDFIVGCDGFHGITRLSLPASQLQTFERTCSYSWLGILADVPPSCVDLIYAHSPHGFALHSMRSSEVSRLYLQVPNDTDLNEWPDDRIWDELAFRFATEDWELRRGPITEKAVLPMRSFVVEPMRFGRVFLAGDAAHIVPPTGAKGLNLAVADVRVLGRAFADWANGGSTELLDAYSDTCLRRIWQVEQFSWSMTAMLHREPAQTPFETRLQLAQLSRIASSPTAAAELAENYTGRAVE
ncbi:4-hydroxybenzoate 3-monooxygenase [Micromonospora sp. NPDC050417]|uniref:4-hydroxybenzoate 3-monooxygenase n=1 Tax=Micromonospora sp. NPDC050417 TaxID=3364280 RepID=UPI00378A8015